MAKTNIKFNNKNYEIDEQSLSTATNALKSHLSTTMAGTGAKVSLGGVDYNIDSTKLSTVTNNFITHLGTIAGSGAEVVVNGTKYSVDSTKLSGALSELGTAFDNLSGGSTPTEERLEGDGAEYYTLAPTALSFRSTAPLNELQEVQINGQTVDPSNYTLEEGSTIVTFPIDYLKTLNVGSYEVTVASESKTVKGDFSVKAPDLNENGFYYNQPYVAFVYAFDAAIGIIFRNNNIINMIDVNNSSTEVGTYTIDGNRIIVSSSLGALHCTVSSDGIYCEELSTVFVLGAHGIISDEEYIYAQTEYNGVDCYLVASVIDATKTSYSPIRTGINGKPTLEVNSMLFSKCVNLTDIPQFPNTLGITGFQNCEFIISATIPKGTTLIGVAAFADCINLKEVVINKEIIKIGYEAFAGCTNLADIVFEGTTEQWNNITKNGNWERGVPATYVQCSDGQVSLV